MGGVCAAVMYLLVHLVFAYFWVMQMIFSLYVLIVFHLVWWAPRSRVGGMGMH